MPALKGEIPASEGKFDACLKRENAEKKKNVKATKIGCEYCWQIISSVWCVPTRLHLGTAGSLGRIISVNGSPYAVVSLLTQTSFHLEF